LLHITDLHSIACDFASSPVVNDMNLKISEQYVSFSMNETDDRLIRLSTVIQTSIAQMLSEKMARQLKKKSLAPAAFANKLFDILESALKGEQEATIHRLNAKVESLYREKESVQQELATERRRFAHENSMVASDSAELHRRYDELDGHYRSLGWRRDQREQRYQAAVQERDHAIRLLRQGLIGIQAANRWLTAELRALRDFVARVAKQERRLMGSARAMLAARVQAEVGRAVAKERKKAERKLAVAATELRSEKLSLDQLRGASQLLLDSVWHISPRGGRVPPIAVEDIPRRIAEVHSHISQSVEDQRKLALEDARRALAADLPELNAHGGDALATAVASAVSERVAEREDALRESLRLAEARERKLRRKLARALAEVHSFAAPATMESPVRGDVALDGLEQLRNNWVAQRQQLDLKMSELSSTLGRS
jgi:hypothetical protein